MKKTNLLSIMTAVAVLMFCSMQGNAKIWRVNNRSNYNGTSTWGSNFGGTATFPVFNQINAAVGSNLVKNSDTLHVEGSPIIYISATITKKLVIIGPGFFLTDNANTSNDGNEAQVANITFNSGSGESSAIGLDIVLNGNGADGYIYISADSITVKRCRMERGVYFNGVGGFKLLTIIENFFSNTDVTNILSSGNGGFVPPGDLIFNNNICQKTLIWELNSTTLWNITECKNNVFAGPTGTSGAPELAFQTTDFSNNIISATNTFVNITAPTGGIAYNISQNALFNATYNNSVVADMTTVFVGGTSSPDSAYEVLPASAAHKSGSDGTDRGAFGGAILSSRYTLSGLGPVPVVYRALSTGEVLSTGLPVTVKARTIK